MSQPTTHSYPWQVHMSLAMGLIATFLLLTAAGIIMSLAHQIISHFNWRRQRRRALATLPIQNPPPTTSVPQLPPLVITIRCVRTAYPPLPIDQTNHHLRPPPVSHSSEHGRSFQSSNVPPPTPKTIITLNPIESRSPSPNIDWLPILIPSVDPEVVRWERDHERRDWYQGQQSLWEQRNRGDSDPE